MSDEENDETEQSPEPSREPKKRKVVRNEFIDDEAELSGDDEVSEDELDSSDDDAFDLDLVDKEAPELDSEEEEEVRGLYHKQLEAEDKRAVLLLQEQLEDKDVAVGQRRRRKFRWQTQEIMENSLKRHYDPDDDDSEEGYDDDFDDDDFDETQPRLRRPTAETLLLGSTLFTTEKPISSNASKSGQTLDFSDDSSSNPASNSRMLAPAATSSLARPQSTSTGTVGMNKFLYRDKEVVEALSTREVVIASREEKDRVIQRELKRVLQSKSIFDQLYS